MAPTTRTRCPQRPAGALDSPGLLVRHDEIPSAAADALDDLALGQITVLGGDGVVTKEVIDALAAWAPTERTGGLDRWITSALLFAEVASADTVYLASGQDWPDALAGGARASGSDHKPLLITRKGGLPGAIEDAIVHLLPERVVVLGGEGAVADTVIEELDAVARSGLINRGTTNDAPSTFRSAGHRDPGA